MKTTGYNAQWLTEALAPSDHPLKENMKPVPSTDFEKAILRRHSLMINAGLSTRVTRSHSNFTFNLMAGSLPITCPTTSPLCL